MRRHGPVGPVDLGIVEGGLVDPALQIVGNQQLRRAAEKAEHAHVGAGPVRQRLRPGRLGIGEVRGAEHADENLRLADLAGRRIDDADPLARIVHERLFPGDMVLAHHRSQPPFEPTKQIAEAAVAVTFRMGLSVFLPEDRHRDARTLQLARQGRPVRLDPPPLALRDPGAPKSWSSRASSVTSSASGHANPAAAARFRLSWIVERATPRRRPISRALTPSW